MTNMTNHLQFIKEKCIESNPNKEWCELRPDGGGYEMWLEGVPCRLADVLLAVDRKRPPKQEWYVRYDGQFRDVRNDAWGNVSWNLLDDRLEKQSDECLTFIWNLLK